MKVMFGNQVFEKNDIIRASLVTSRLYNPDKHVSFWCKFFGLTKKDDYLTKYYVNIVLKEKEIDGASMFTVGYRNKELIFKFDSKEKAEDALKSLVG